MSALADPFGNGRSIVVSNWSPGTTLYRKHGQWAFRSPVGRWFNRHFQGGEEWDQEKSAAAGA
jgi:hypothetical protein